MFSSSLRLGRLRAGFALVAAAAMLILSAGSVLAWTKPTLAALCADDAHHYAWQITLPREADYRIELSWSSSFSSTWTVDFGSSGTHGFTTDRGGATLYARWQSDKAVKTQAAANGELCVQPTPTPTPRATPIPTPKPAPTSTPVAPTPTATPTPEGSQAASTATPKPTETPAGSVAASTATPRPLPDTAAGTTSTPLAAAGFGLLLVASVGTLSWVSRGSRLR